MRPGDSEVTSSDEMSDGPTCFAESEGWSEFTPSFPSMQSESCRLVSAISKIGESIGDVQLVRVLGEGAFGKVFLGRQTSLDREVAVKITANLGHEGRMMATLDHPLIVQVFSESVDDDKGIRMLCMQYVRGATLQQLIKTMRSLPPESRDGEALLRIVDEFSGEDDKLDPAKLHDREILENCRLDEAVCWIGSFLAEALAYAHRRDVLHRDIKPANVIVNQYGHPMLTDFGLSARANGAITIGAAVFGGTIGFMAPEHIQALNPSNPRTEDAVDQRSDIFSLGAVLLDLIARESVHCGEACTLAGKDIDHVTANQRDIATVSGQMKRSEVAAPLATIIRRCLEPDPDKRYPLADTLAMDLRGAFSLLKINRRLSPSGPWSKWASSMPFCFLLTLTCVPNLAASAANIWYNVEFVIEDLASEQQHAFIWMTVWYNVVVFVLMAVLLDRTLFEAYRRWCRVKASFFEPTDDVNDVRGRVLRLPIWTLVLGGVGWLPFAVVVPAGMEFLSGPIPWGVVMQISVAFTVTGLVAIIGNYFVVTYVAVGVLYPRLFSDYSLYQLTAERELSAIPARNRVFQVLAGLTPLLAATFFLLIGPDLFTDVSFNRFRMVLLVLIGLGIVGFTVATRATTRLSEIIGTLTRPIENRPHGRSVVALRR